MTSRAQHSVLISLYTVNFHYLRHVPEILCQYGPMQGYGARCMEREVGLFGKLIKSTKEPAVNAGNQSQMVAANRFHKRTNDQEIMINEGDNSNAQIRTSRAFYCTETADCPELWPPHPFESSMDNFAIYNLMHHTRNFWARVQDLKASSLPPLDNKITVAKRRFLDKTVYDCRLLLRSHNKGTFLKLKLPVDRNAYGGLTSEDKSESRDFFGEAIMLLVIIYMSDTRILSLVNRVQHSRITIHGYPFGRTAYGGTDRYYVCDVCEIASPAVVIPSPTKDERFCYAYPDILKEKKHPGKYKQA
ncbi:hypothetical protein BCR43DRAFT_277360 [Syncephalastrum racemosum]|uniref:Uncharacterized protein n=1 Tax=Syncephalastrum racemosum TaxID=13706 RepID=A0A1X2HCF3_SYNRA|nr:hypothetical protein BCR43DRAFT_277360 [Syncephalastrum racemosum]